MPSGKRSRETRRAAAAPPPVRKKGAGRKASPVVLAVVLTRGSSSSSSSAPPSALPEAAAVNAVFNGIPQSGTTLGSPKAPVTMQEFIDLQCPFCDQFERGPFPSIVKRYVRPGKLKVQMKPLAFIGPDSVTGQHAVLAAGHQNRAFNYAAQLYQNQGTENTGWLNDNMVRAAAASIPGVNVDQLLSDMSSDAVKSDAQGVDQAGSSVKSTPTILVGRSGGPLHLVAMSSPTDTATLAAAINSALNS